MRAVIVMFHKKISTTIPRGLRSGLTCYETMIRTVKKDSISYVIGEIVFPEAVFIRGLVIPTTERPDTIMMAFTVVALHVDQCLAWNIEMIVMRYYLIIRYRVYDYGQNINWARGNKNFSWFDDLQSATPGDGFCVSFASQKLPGQSLTLLVVLRWQLFFLHSLFLYIFITTLSLLPLFLSPCVRTRQIPRGCYI